MNPNDARLLRIVTQSCQEEGLDETPLADGATRFEVVVEAAAGSVLGRSGQPYWLRIDALDLTGGANPHSSMNNFSQQRYEAFTADFGWPKRIARFLVTILDINAVDGHLFRYYAILSSTNNIQSFVESPLFLLARPQAHLAGPQSGFEDPSASPSSATDALPRPSPEPQPPRLIREPSGARRRYRRAWLVALLLLIAVAAALVATLLLTSKPPESPAWTGTPVALGLQY